MPCFGDREIAIDQGGDTTAIVQIGLSDGVPDGNDQNDAGTGLALLVQ